VRVEVHIVYIRISNYVKRLLCFNFFSFYLYVDIKVELRRFPSGRNLNQNNNSNTENINSEKRKIGDS